MNLVEHTGLAQPFREFRQTVGELEEHGKAKRLRALGEVVDDLLELRPEAQGQLGTLPGSVERSIGTRTALPHSTHEPS